MKPLLALLTCILLISCAGRQPLTKSQWVGEAAWQAIHVIDWGQTLNIADNPDYHEKNPLIGRHPSRGKVNLYMGASAIIHPIITYLLPEDYKVLGINIHPRWLWIGGTITTSGLCVINNNAIGLKANF